MMEVVCGVIENAEGQFLACLRPAGKHLGGLWEFPGGKVECGESPESALIRELREELAVDIEVGSPLGPVIWNYNERMIRLRPYYCRILAGEPRALEHEQLHWCAPQNFDSLSWAAADVPILHQISANRSRENQQDPRH